MAAMRSVKSALATLKRVSSLSRPLDPTLCMTRQLSTSQNLNSTSSGFGICIDIDGVLLRGKAPIQAATEAFKLMTDKSGKFKYPVVFLTNSSIPEAEKAEEISEMFNVKATAEHFVMATSPLCLFKSYHHKKCLFLGQDNISEMARSLGFSNPCTIEEVLQAFPLLDAISHQKRPIITEMSKKPPPPEALEWMPIEAIILFTTPLQWGTVLQVTSDLLLTQGDPRRYINPNDLPSQLPVIVCNPDMQFMHVSHLPRFGHGSFVLCLEEIYKKLTGKMLQYENILGKPSEASYRFAEDRLNNLSQSLGWHDGITRMYMIGDNQEVDIVGGNRYHEYVKIQHEFENNYYNDQWELPGCWTLPPDADLGPQNVREVKSYLVKTGVFQEEAIQATQNTTYTNNTMDQVVQSQRDFNTDSKYLIPYKICSDVHEAVRDIIDMENV